MTAEREGLQQQQQPKRWVREDIYGHTFWATKHSGELQSGHIFAAAAKMLCKSMVAAFGGVPPYVPALPCSASWLMDGEVRFIQREFNFWSPSLCLSQNGECLCIKRLQTHAEWVWFLLLWIDCRGGCVVAVLRRSRAQPKPQKKLL